MAGCSDCGNGFVEGKCACSFDTWAEWMKHREGAALRVLEGKGFHLEGGLPESVPFDSGYYHLKRLARRGTGSHETQFGVHGLQELERVAGYVQKNPDADATEVWLVACLGVKEKEL